MLRELLQQMSEHIEENAISLDENGHCALLIDQQFPVYLQQNNDQEVVFFANLPTLADVCSKDIYEELLHSNFFGLGAKGFALGLNPQTREVVLSRRVYESALTFERFETLLADLVEAMAFWKIQLENYQHNLIDTITSADQVTNINQMDATMMTRV
ncbi:type III secretion system chaperone [Algicola sagamiensis]|uniref:type III secretion system chaperone n=1 Tax=Algicola sagamiensis TaxID=163869 RepID=UPI0003712BE5|nr:type III secretion system chaperone [Algicola sagamiensis]